MSRVGEVWVFHDERDPKSYIWLIVKETDACFDMMNLETGDLAILDPKILDTIYFDEDYHWWERIA